MDGKGFLQTFIDGIIGGDRRDAEAEGRGPGEGGGEEPSPGEGGFGDYGAAPRRLAPRASKCKCGGRRQGSMPGLRKRR